MRVHCVASHLSCAGFLLETEHCVIPLPHWRPPTPNMLSSYDQVIHINDDKYLSSGVTPDEQRVVGLGHVEADLVKISGYLRMSGSGCLLEAIEILFKSAYRLWV